MGRIISTHVKDALKSSEDIVDTLLDTMIDNINYG